MWTLLLAASAAAAPLAPTRGALAVQRATLAQRYAETPDAAVLAEARTAVLDAIVDVYFPAWEGTPWEFHGTSQVPGEGSIACGYYVSTILRDAGFRVERVRLAQQPAEWIQRTFLASGDLTRFHDKPVPAVLEHIRASGDGLYLVGLDHHVGFLLKEGERLDMCHASYIEPVAVTCQPAATAAALPSGYTVVGKLFDDEMMRGWLEGRDWPTWRPRR